MPVVSAPFLPLSRVIPQGKGGKGFRLAVWTNSLCCGRRGGGSLPALPADADRLRMPSTALGRDAGTCRLSQAHAGAKDGRLHSTRSS